MCDECGKTFNTKHRLKHHEISHSTRKLSCSLCSFSTKYPDYMKRHSRIAHGIVQQMLRYQCYLCKSMFRRIVQLRSHFHQMHPMPKKDAELFRFQCHVCNARYEHTDNLRAHLRRIHQLKSCQICDEDLMPNDTTHTCIGDRPLACEYCIHSFETQHALLAHLDDDHTGEEKLTYLCDICRRKFRMQLLMDAHREKHTLASFACDKCTEAFDTKLALYNHRRVAHTTRSK